MSDTLIGLLPGAVGGVCNVFAGHPIDLVKVRMQTGALSQVVGSNTGTAAAVSLQPSVSTFSALRLIFRTEGVLGLYRGVTAPLLAATPAFAISFWSYDCTKSIMLRMNPPDAQQQLKIQQEFLAGGISGIPLAAVFGPGERIKCLMQVNGTRYKGFFDCVRNVYAEGGLRSLFRGTGATMLRDCPGNAAYFGFYAVFKRGMMQYEGAEGASLLVSFIAGGLAGVCNWIVAIPFDVVKSRYQTAPAGQYRGIVHVFQSLVAQEGPSALFRGISPALLRAFPANAATLAGVETARSMFGLTR